MSPSRRRPTATELGNIADRAEGKRDEREKARLKAGLDYAWLWAGTEGEGVKLTNDYALGLAIGEYARAHGVQGTPDIALAAAEAIEALHAGRAATHPSFELAAHLALNGHTQESGAVYRPLIKRDGEIRRLLRKANRQLQHAQAARSNTERSLDQRTVERTLEEMLGAKGHRRLSVSAYAELIRKKRGLPKSRLHSMRRWIAEYLRQK